jgi:hypothetical protein
MINLFNGVTKVTKVTLRVTVKAIDRDILYNIVTYVTSILQYPRMKRYFNFVYFFLYKTHIFTVYKGNEVTNDLLMLFFGFGSKVTLPSIWR